MNGWHLDRTISVAGLIVLLVQTAGITWWASAIEQRVTVMEKTLLNRASLVERYFRTESNVFHAAATLEKIAERLDRLERINGPRR